MKYALIIVTLLIPVFCIEGADKSDEPLTAPAVGVAVESVEQQKDKLLRDNEALNKEIEALKYSIDVQKAEIVRLRKKASGIGRLAVHLTITSSKLLESLENF